ncbi:MAG: toll/interleukin-1 receptor domain-containing protein [bacterium]
MERQLMLRLLRECSTNQWNKYRANHPEWQPDLRGLELDTEGFGRGVNDPFIPENFNLKGSIYDHTTTFYYGFNPEKYGLIFQESTEALASNAKQNGVATKRTRSADLDIFISHSSRDKKTAEALVEFIRAALGISPKKIRCSSVSGYRLHVGLNNDAQLRKEVHHSKILIGLITRASIHSAYVLFELGARWGTAKPMFPILACGVETSFLSGPLKSISSINCDDPAQLHQLIDEIATLLGLEKESPAAYQKNIDLLVRLSLAPKNSNNPSRPHTGRPLRPV